jgi:hypothetical protein
MQVHGTVRSRHAHDPPARGGPSIGAADLQDLLLNEPGFFIEGLLWAANDAQH